MSKGLFDARRKLAQSNSLIRQGNIINAVQSLHSGLQDMLREQLLKSERDEFENLLTQTVRQIGSNKQVLDVFQMRLEYTPGQEKELMENVKVLLDALEAVAIDEAAKRFMEIEADKECRFNEGVAALESGKAEKCREIFDALVKEHPNDVAMLVNMAEAYEKAGLLEEAATLLEKAAALDPGAAYIHNKRGIIYRKMKKYEQSEQAFNTALGITPDDPYLYFNIGRLYVDWQNWPKALDAAGKALELAPGFNEAKMMAEYAQKRI